MQINRISNTPQRSTPNFKSNHSIHWANTALNEKLGNLLVDFPPKLTLYKISQPNLPGFKTFTAHYPEGYEAEEDGFCAGITAIRKKLEVGTFFVHNITENPYPPDIQS